MHGVGILIAMLLTVGTYSEGNLLVVYDMRRHVLPTAPSPTTTHLIVCILRRCLQTQAIGSSLKSNRYELNTQSEWKLLYNWD